MDTSPQEISDPKPYRRSWVEYASVLIVLGALVVVIFAMFQV